MLARWLDERACRFDEEDASQLDEICTWLGSTDQLLHGRLTSTTTGSGTTALSRRAPTEVLLAVLGAHPSLPNEATHHAKLMHFQQFCHPGAKCTYFSDNLRGSTLFQTSTSTRPEFRSPRSRQILREGSFTGSSAASGNRQQHPRPLGH